MNFWNFKLNDQIGEKILKRYHCAMGLLHPTALQRSGMRNEMMSTFDRTFLANNWNRVSNIWSYFFNKQLKQGVQIVIGRVFHSWVIFLDPIIFKSSLFDEVLSIPNRIFAPSKFHYVFSKMDLNFFLVLIE